MVEPGNCINHCTHLLKSKDFCIGGNTTHLSFTSYFPCRHVSVYSSVLCIQVLRCAHAYHYSKLCFILFEFRSFRSARTIAGTGGVIGPLVRPKQTWASHLGKNSQKGRDDIITRTTQDTKCPICLSRMHVGKSG